MPIAVKGNIRDANPDGIARQPGSRLTEKNDGTLEGVMVYECDRSRLTGIPNIGYPHPLDSRAECYSREVEYLTLGRIKATLYFFGLQSAQTEAIINYSPNVNQDSIVSHPDFEEFAGTRIAPNKDNGAQFDFETGEFLGFFNPKVTDLFGAEYYLTPAIMVTRTYWSRSAPKPSNLMTIVPEVKGFIRPKNVKNFLLTGVPYRRVESHYQITEQYLGSGPKGWSKTLYPS